jgi:peptidoglycan/xylan/chitin deacetylase (PgdA/CDA1 family)
VAAPALGQVAQLLWLVTSSRTMTKEAFGTVLGAQALYMALQILVNAGSWLYGARAAAAEPLSDEARAQTTRVRVELALLGVVVSAAFAVAAGGAMRLAVLPYAVALLLFALMNTWEPFGSGDRKPYLAYIAFRSVVPAVASSLLLIAGMRQPVVVPGLAECATILIATAVFRLAPLRHVRQLLVTRAGPRAGILMVSLPQIAANVVMATGTLALSLTGAAVSAGVFAAGIKVLGGFTTLVISAALDSFRGLARQRVARDEAGARTGLPEMVTVLSWLSLALMSALALGAPVVSTVLLNHATETTVAVLIAVFAAIPPAGLVAALTTPMTARGEEAALGATYALGLAVVVVGAGLILLVHGDAPAELGAALVIAQIAMAIHLVPRARPLLGGVSAGELVMRASAGATVGLIAAFVPSLRPLLLALLLVLSSAGLAVSAHALWGVWRARRGPSTAIDPVVQDHAPAGQPMRRRPFGVALALASGTTVPVSAGPPRTADRRPVDLKPPRLLPSYARAALTRTRTRFHVREPVDGAGQLRILYYHRIADEHDLLAVKPREFARQMDLLAREGFTVLDIASAWDRFAAGDGGGRLIGLSFDDGYRDFETHALPVLSQYGFSASVFVCPGLIDGTASMAWYRDAPPLLSWDSIIALDGEQIRFEPHTVTHPNLTALDAASAAVEIRDSKRVLEGRLGRPARVFCYPGGLGGAREQALVREAGFEFATSCEPGVTVRATNRLALPRTAVERHDSVGDFRAKLAGVHDKSLPGRALYRRLRYGRKEEHDVKEVD